MKIASYKKLKHRVDGFSGKTGILRMERVKAGIFLSND